MCKPKGISYIFKKFIHVNFYPFFTVPTMELALNGVYSQAGVKDSH